MNYNRRKIFCTTFVLIIEVQKNKLSTKQYEQLKNDLSFIIVDKTSRYRAQLGNASLFIRRGCSYGGEMTWFNELAHLYEISPSLGNSYKCKLY